jgi:hypothetical protein
MVEKFILVTLYKSIHGIMYCSTVLLRFQPQICGFPGPFSHYILVG